MLDCSCCFVALDSSMLVKLTISTLVLPRLHPRGDLSLWTSIQEKREIRFFNMDGTCISITH